jgi:hypothetical protein
MVLISGTKISQLLRIVAPHSPPSPPALSARQQLLLLLR